MTIKLSDDKDEVELAIASEREDMYGGVMQFIFHLSAIEEPAWFSRGDLKINFFKPDCQVTQDLIDEFADPNLKLQMAA